jgi:hypothetical protein
MAEEKDERTLGLSPAQVAGSALAAVSGALLASFAGTTGTIIGTAVGSVVATVGAALYTWSLRRTSAAVRRTAAQVRQTALLTGPLPRTVAQGPMRSRDGHGPEDQLADEAIPEEPRRRSLPWGRTLLASVAVTVVALGGITTFEAITGRPISSLLGGSDSRGTSVGNLVGSDDQSSKHPAPKDNTTPTNEQSQAPDPTPRPSDVPGVPVPSVTPTPAPTEPSSQPSVVPEGAPAPAPGADTAPNTAPNTAPGPTP